jgi:hypothetical protein
VHHHGQEVVAFRIARAPLVERRQDAAVEAVGACPRRCSGVGSQSGICNKRSNGRVARACKAGTVAATVAVWAVLSTLKRAAVNEVVLSDCWLLMRRSPLGPPTVIE